MPPDNDEVGSNDPFNLYPGSGSNMFKNENLNEKNKTKQSLEAQRANLPKGIRGLVQDLEDLLAEMRLQNDSLGSYLRTMFVDGEEAIKDPKGFQEKLAVEFRSRELNLQTINRIQLCLNKHKPTQNQ